MVSRGSSDPDANGDVYKMARLIREGRGLLSAPTAWPSSGPAAMDAGPLGAMLTAPSLQQLGRRS